MRWFCTPLLLLLLFVSNTFAYDCDVNGDGKEGLAEAIHALQVVAGISIGMPCGSDPPPPGGACPSVCTGGCSEENVCNIYCNANCANSDIICPSGFSCQVNCLEPYACSGVNVTCPDDYSCRVYCDGNYSCSGANIICSAEGTCNVTCDGGSACDGTFLLCGNDACTATCAMGCISWPTGTCGDSCDCSF